MDNISMDKKNTLQYVSDVSEVASNDMYMTIVVQMFSTDVNLNNVRVTEDFITDIVDNQEKYTWVPFCVDKQLLRDGRIYSLQHKMDEMKERFTTEQIGSFVRFWKEDMNGVVILYGEARIPKRDMQVCDMLEKMYDLGMLKVSFEIMSGVCSYDGDVVVVDANEANQLVGMAVVSIPAYPDASSAVLMVAEAESGVEQMEQSAATETKMQEGENMDEKMIQNTEELEKPEAEQAAVEAEVIEAEAVESEAVAAEETVVAEEVKPDEEPEAVEEKDEEPETETAEAAEEMPECVEEEVAVEMPEPPAIDVDALQCMIEDLRKQVEDLTPYKQMAEANEMEKEKNLVESFIQKAGLSREDEHVCAAADELDYKSLVEAWVNAPSVEAEAPTVQAASFSFTMMQPTDMRKWLYDNK